MISHGMRVAVREDHQVALGEQHRLVYPFHGEPARSPCDNMKARDLPWRHEETPGRAHVSEAIEGGLQAYRLHYVGQDIFLIVSEKLRHISS